MLFKRAPHGVRFFFAPFKKLVRQIFFAYFLPNLPNLPNKKFSGIFFGDFFIFFPPFAARRRLKCKIFTVSRARVKKFNGRKFYENKFFSGANWQVLASLKCRKYFFSDMQCVFFLVGRGFSVSSSAQCVIRFRRRSGGVSVSAGAQGGVSVSAGAQGAFFRVSFQPSFRKKLHS